MDKAGRTEKCISRFITGILLVFALVITCPSFSIICNASDLSYKLYYNVSTVNVYLMPNSYASYSINFNGQIYYDPHSMNTFQFHIDISELNSIKQISSGYANFDTSFVDASLTIGDLTLKPSAITNSYSQLNFVFQFINTMDSSGVNEFGLLINLSSSVWFSNLAVTTGTYLQANTTATLNVYSQDYFKSDYIDNYIYNQLVKQNSTLNNIYKKLNGFDSSLLPELQKQTEEQKKQTEEQKKQTQALTKYDGADKMDSDSANLGTALDEVDNLENSLFESAGAHIGNFDITLGFDFNGQILASIGFLSTIITRIIAVMHDFSMIYTVGMCLIVIGIVLGLWKFSSGSGGDSS